MSVRELAYIDDLTQLANRLARLKGIKSQAYNRRELVKSLGLIQKRIG